MHRTHMPRIERGSGWETHCRPDRLAGVPLASEAPVAAADLPCHVGSLEDVELDRAGSDCRQRPWRPTSRQSRSGTLAACDWSWQ